VLQEVCDLWYGCLRSWVSMLEGLHLSIITFDWVCQIKGGLSYWKMVYANIHSHMLWPMFLSLILLELSRLFWCVMNNLYIVLKFVSCFMTLGSICHFLFIWKVNINCSILMFRLIIKEEVSWEISINIEC
jgi:hypothetical protein